MSSFLVSKEDVKNFVNVPVLYQQQGIYFVYSAPPEIIQKLVPPPLEPVAPVIVGYLVQFGGTNFGGAYVESAISTPCRYKDITAGYTYNMMLSGHGADSGIVVGANCCGIPKKRADYMDLNRIGNHITAKVVRHGVTLIECEIDLGRYNAASASMFLGDPEPGSENIGSSFFHTFNMLQTENGNSVFSDVNLVQLFTKAKCLKWEPGALSSIAMRSSEDDPFGEFKVMQPIGAAYFQNEYIEMTKTVKLAELDTDATMPYLMTGRYDRSMMGHYSTYLTGFYHDV